MLKYCKISKYKIRKILKNFVEDYTSTQSSKITKLSRNTTDRYYNIFRKICLSSVIQQLPTSYKEESCIGYIEAEHAPETYFRIYKIDKKTFIYEELGEKPNNPIHAILDEDFKKFVGFVCKRYYKFYGLSGQGIIYQYFESILRYNSTKEELFNYIWKQLQKKQPRVFS